MLEEYHVGGMGDEVLVQEAAALFRNLGNPNRLAILAALLDGEHAVGELESMLGIRQPILSQQLAILRDAGLLTTTRDRKSILYRLADSHAAVISRVLRAVLDPAPAVHQAPTAAPRQAATLPTVSAAVFARVEPADH
jgi:DNA-binding transcriptional ArsR family regulator